jgi:hypothetical protein
MFFDSDSMVGKFNLDDMGNHVKTMFTRPNDI